ncbi:hypothetical protein D9756_007041 [Leucocoprinus leucothites]|uniref:Uncharacterized protein n=1 Tax=Leucocoprinus leucothites TaxID=201217 RepID=A0A8H5D6A3_9AGAR|nr:hypothetical protein D9756_007041 [Leucoagaricus leucothites]
MRSFTFIAAFASLAFTAVTSALPLVGSDSLAAPKWVRSPAVAAADIETRDIFYGNDPGNHDGNGNGNGNNGGSNRGIGDVLDGLNGRIGPLSQDLTNRISGSIAADAALDISITVLGQIKVLLTAAVAEIRAIISVRGGGALVLNGQTLDARGIAGILGTLIITIVKLLDVVVRVTASVRTQVLLTLIVDISALLSVIIGLVVTIVGNLLVVLTPLITVVVRIIVDLNLTGLIQVLKIPYN